MRTAALFAMLAAAGLTFPLAARAHVPGHAKGDSVKALLAYQERAYAHARYVCVRGSGEPKRFHCAASVWIKRELAKTRAKLAPPVSWASIQIRYATIIGQQARSDPWPNCPDPIWNPGSSWQDTVNCENTGNWYDSPGYYRCGLQFDPMWERHFGVRFCP